MEMYELLEKFMKFLKHHSDDKFYVMPGKIRQWLTSVYDRAKPVLQEYFPQFGILRVSII